MSSELYNTPLGKSSPTPTQYDPKQLIGITRKRSKIEMFGWDFWTAYDFFYHDSHGKPHAAIFKMAVPCHSQRLVESKSFKLYLHSFLNEKISPQELVELIAQDLQALLLCPVELSLESFRSVTLIEPSELGFKPLDEATPSCRRLYTNCFRSNCPVTGQPDFATILVEYATEKESQSIDPSALSTFLASFKLAASFHENCVETIYEHLFMTYSPTSLCVMGRYTRRGGIDINPFRASSPHTLPHDLRCPRQ